MLEKSKILALNWKMNPATLNEATELFTNYKEAFEVSGNFETVVCPPSIYINNLVEIKENSALNCKLGLQDISAKESGAVTGEISGLMAKSIGVEYVIIGHSETRALHKLSNSEVNQKVIQTVKNGLIPMLCIGFQENSEITDIQWGELESQIREGLQNVEPDSNLQSSYNLIVAYEPVWAIGTGKTATKELVEEVNEFIKNILSDIFGAGSDKIGILYGGSVNETNIAEFAQSDLIDGFLVGGASLVPAKVLGMTRGLQNI